MPVREITLLRRTLTVVLVFALFIFAPCSSVAALEPARVQLKWLHNFQFAGYYVALEKGFYRDAGLDVTLLEGGPGIKVETAVASGAADFGVGNSAIMLNRSKGDDFVVVAQIFQHSPAILLTPRKTGIRSVKDMAGKRFMSALRNGDILALLKKNGITEDQLVTVPSQGDPHDLISGKADVMLAYSFNEPFVLEQAGEPYLSFSPLNAGFDFYGDNLFTTGNLIETRPEFVEAFRKATLHGWDYALHNKNEVIDLIRAKYARGRSHEWLHFEAEQMVSLIRPGLVEIGYQSLSRWKNIRDIYAELGMLPVTFEPTSMIYTPQRQKDYRLLLTVSLVCAAIIGALTWLVLLFRRMNRTLQKNIAERDRAVLALQQSESRFRMLMEGIPNVAVKCYDFDGTVTFWNRAAEILYGYTAEEAIGRTRFELVIPEGLQQQVREQMQRMQQTGVPVPPCEMLLRRKDGSPVLVLASYAVVKPLDRPLQLFCLDIDLTERQRAEGERHKLEQQLQHAKKLESLGILAGGIAHDFNNILMSIIGNVDLALLRSKKELPVVANLHNIEQAAERAAELSQQMLAYSGRGKFVVEPIDLSKLLREMVQILEVAVPKTVRLGLELGSAQMVVEGDATQLRQVVMNLVINAAEAIGDATGEVTISTGRRYCDREYLRQAWAEEIPAGDYICLEVADTGCGMDQETSDLLFDPFFTTKFTGRGLGLSAVQGIVRGHHGGIRVSSKPGQGSNFKILLPASHKPLAQPTAMTSPDGWQGEGEVLLVDDEEKVRLVGSQLLEELGFSVVTANNGREALEAYRQTPDLSFVLLDLAMPEMDGVDCFRELRQLDPEVRVLLSSGYTEQDVAKRFADDEPSGFIQKPFRLQDLEVAVRKLISES